MPPPLTNRAPENASAGLGKYTSGYSVHPAAAVYLNAPMKLHFEKGDEAPKEMQALRPITPFLWLLKL